MTTDKKSARERRTFPITLVLEGQPCLVVGGGRLAGAKAVSLLQAGAEVVVFAAEVAPALQQLADLGAIRLYRRAARPEDVADAVLTFLAHDDYSFDPALVEAARRAGRLINVVDVTEACNFYMPAIVRRGPVTVAVSTSGKSPRLAAQLEEKIAAVVGEEYGELAGILGDLREEMKERSTDAAVRAASWRAILDSDVLTLLREGRNREAEELARALLPAAAGELVV